MGVPYHELIPAAILLDSPGLNREELGEKLQEAQYSAGQVPENAPWDASEDGKSFTPEDLPRILGLRYSETFQQFQEPGKDTNGMPLSAPNLETDFQVAEGSLLAKRYKVISHIGNSLGELISLPTDSSTIRAGDTASYIDNYLEETNYFVRSVDGNRAQVQEITALIKTETFETLEDLYRVWPQYRPENMFDFSQTNGRFNSGWSEGFLWKLADGKYYLDEATLDQIPAGFSIRDLTMGYTDLILTAEAIRHGAWKLLSYRGLSHLGDFLREFPDSRARYEKAVWDSHTSLFAKKREMTYIDFLRMRLIPSGLEDREGV
jgi:hypothetical protein